MLDDIISILILNQLLCMLMQLLQNWSCLFLCAVLQDTLNYSATVGVSREGEHLRSDTQTPSMMHKQLKVLP